MSRYRHRKVPEGTYVDLLGDDGKYLIVAFCSRPTK